MICDNVPPLLVSLDSIDQNASKEILQEVYKTLQKELEDFQQYQQPNTLEIHFSKVKNLFELFLIKERRIKLSKFFDPLSLNNIWFSYIGYLISIILKNRFQKIQFKKFLVIVVTKFNLL